MAELFNNVFNKASIYDMLFFNVKSVLICPTLDDLSTKNPLMFERWKYLSKNKYNCDLNEETNNFGFSNGIYEKHAIYYPEFTKIIAITYASLFVEDGQIKRDFKKIANQDEKLVIATFIDELNILSSAVTKSSPPFFPIFCGHNIIGYDIPLLIKRHILLNKEEENKQLPLILKNVLNAKPWESAVIDTTNVWKFNGYDNMPLMLISEFLGLKKTVDVLPLDELSKYYWKNIEEKPKETLEYIALQSATQTNLVIQLMNVLRQY